MSISTISESIAELMTPNDPREAARSAFLHLSRVLNSDIELDEYTVVKLDRARDLLCGVAEVTVRKISGVRLHSGFVGSRVGLVHAARLAAHTQHPGKIVINHGGEIFYLDGYSDEGHSLMLIGSTADDKRAAIFYLEGQETLEMLVYNEKVETV